MNPLAFLEKLKTSPHHPKTAAPPPAMYHPFFQAAIQAGEPVLVIAPTADASGTVRSALTAAQDFPGADIRVFDTRSVAAPLGTMVMLAVEWAEAGLEADAIIARLQAMAPRARLYILMDTLDFVFRGGRIGGAQHLVGSLLQVKPILELREGRIEAHSQLRTKRRALDCLQDLVVTQCPRDGSGHLCVVHTGAEPEAQALAAYLKTQLGLTDVPIRLMPPAIIVHAGPGALAVGFFIRG
jgi:DegV family protein with EDD domain